MPNRLTISRILIIPLILVFLIPFPALAIFSAWNGFIEDFGQLIAMFLFAIASITDLIDGKLARRHNQVTNFGKFLDPIADKMLVTSIMIALTQENRINALFVIIVISREFIVTGVRLLAADKGVVIAASNLGKSKTVSQIVAILIILSEKTLILLTGGFIPAAWITGLGDLAMLFAVIMTLISGVDYLKKNLSYLKE